MLRVRAPACGGDKTTALTSALLVSTIRSLGSSMSSLGKQLQSAQQVDGNVLSRRVRLCRRWWTRARWWPARCWSARCTCWAAMRRSCGAGPTRSRRPSRASTRWCSSMRSHCCMRCAPTTAWRSASWCPASRAAPCARRSRSACSCGAPSGALAGLGCMLPSHSLAL